MRQGAVGHVRIVVRDGRRLVEKRMTDPVRHGTEVRALRALAGSGLPVPEIVAERPGSILMTLRPGRRLDELDPDARREGLRASASALRMLHALHPPAGLSPAPDDAAIIARYRDAGGPPLPLEVPPASGRAFCHGDWSDGNLLATGARITGIVDWESAHVGDPLRELARAAWAAGRKDPHSAAALIDAYGAEPAAVRAWYPIHAAELWLWFAEAGPAEYLDRLTAELRAWPD
ncbi:phosphotransferase family protein [Microbacterium sp. EF45047]|uniref:phosphotransferase family protein n=1 Tax=Microbacterium sp. EF45047 TaxID=2809708 RepID=UPI00234B9095|nr:phosphotransferase [Microbacterium sp. EF45047]WCM55751.1 phosphotransferase [Microbacterium sp. EF45047]